MKLDTTHLKDTNLMNHVHVVILFHTHCYFDNHGQVEVISIVVLGNEHDFHLTPTISATIFFNSFIYLNSMPLLKIQTRKTCLQTTLNIDIFDKEYCALNFGD
jgi:hypothetical protein